MTEVRPLRAYAEVDLGRQRSPQHEAGDHVVPYLRAANVKDGRLELDDVKQMNFTPQEQEHYRLRPGDVLVTEGSGSLSAVGASAVWSGELEGAVCFQNTLLRLRPRAGTDGRFLAWWARYAFADGLFASLATGANIHHLSATGLRSVPVTYMPLAEQRAIANFLDTETARIDALITKKQALLAAVRELAAGRRAQIATGRASGHVVTDSGREWLGAIPAHWPMRRLKHVARMESGHTPSKSRPELWANPEFPWVTLNDVGSIRDAEFLDSPENLISREGLAASSARMLPAGTVMLSRDATIGRTAIMARPMATSQHFANWVCGSELRPRYLWLLLDTVMQQHFDSLTAGSTLRTIGMPDLLGFEVPVPSLVEQDAVISMAARIRDAELSARARLGRQIQLLRERRQTLITVAVTGELAVGS